MSARLHSVPYAVLHARVTGKLTIDSHVGRCLILSPELEKSLVAHCLSLNFRGFGFSLLALKEYAKSVAIGVDSFKASDEWAQSFLTRHDLALRVSAPHALFFHCLGQVAEEYDRLRTGARNEQVFSEYFSMLETAMKKVEELSGGTVPVVRSILFFCRNCTFCRPCAEFR